MTGPISSGPNSFRISVIGAALALLSCAGLLAHKANADQQPITVFAAASLAEVMPALSEAWQTKHGGTRVRISLAASGVIARQIEAGAAADLFISANQKWINYLTSHGHSATAGTVVAQTRLAMVLPCSDTAAHPHLTDSQTLKLFLASRRFAMADPKVSPAGEYTKIALEKMAIWDTVKTNATYAGNVRLALLLTERGGLPGFVYAVDARKSTLACLAFELPASSYPAIKYVGIVPQGRNANAGATAHAFLAWLTGPQAAVIWQQHGFLPSVPE